jgi:hypothetical protein
LLEPARRVEFGSSPPRPVDVARGHWADRKVWQFRRSQHRELNVYRRRAFGRVVVVERQPDRRPRGDWRAWLHIAMQAMAERADVTTGLCGEWQGKKFKRFLNRHQWAAIVGCTLKQWDTIVAVIKSAGYIKPRRQRREREQLPTGVTYRSRGPASLIVTGAFWQLSGAWGAVLRLMRDRRRAKRKEQQAQEPPRQHPPRAEEPRELDAAERERIRASWQEPPPS